LADVAGSGWLKASTRHADLEAFHTQVLGATELSPQEEVTLRGARLGRAIEEIVRLSFDGAYRAEARENERYKKALEDMKDLEACEKDLTRAEDFIDQVRKKRLQVQVQVSQGSADALELDAQIIADRYAAVLSEVQGIDAYLSNAVWSGLWWRAGVASRLAGDERVGKDRIRQAAAVAIDNRLDTDAVPPSVLAWLRDGENEVLRSAKGTVTVDAPAHGTVTVDGREVELAFGEEQIDLAAGVHRFVFWVEGSDPIMRLVSVLSGEDHTVVWYRGERLAEEEYEMLGGELVLPELKDEGKPKSVFIGAGARAGVTLGRPTFGVEVALRVLPKGGSYGFQLGAALLVPTEPYWMEDSEELRAFARLHVGPAARWTRGKFRLAGVVGGYFDPWLGAGPLGTLEFGWQLRPQVGVTLDVRAGYDVTPHFPGIPRYVAGGGVGVWF
jgi:hypothetical protein